MRAFEATGLEGETSREREKKSAVPFISFSIWRMNHASQLSRVPSPIAIEFARAYQSSVRLGHYARLLSRSGSRLIRGGWPLAAARFSLPVLQPSRGPRPGTSEPSRPRLYESRANRERCSRYRERPKRFSSLRGLVYR